MALFWPSRVEANKRSVCGIPKSYEWCRHNTTMLLTLAGNRFVLIWRHTAKEARKMNAAPT